MPKRLNPNLAKIHRSYLVGEIAEVFGVHANTVREWVKQGLPVNDRRRPMLILGVELRRFLQMRNREAKHPCKLDEMYCLKCRKPQQPALGMVEYIPFNDATGQLKGLCPSCDSVINRFVKITDLDQMRPLLDISFTGNKKHLISKE